MEKKIIIVGSANAGTEFTEELLGEILGSGKITKAIPEAFPGISTEELVDEKVVLSPEDIKFLEMATEGFNPHATVDHMKFGWVDLYAHFNGMSCMQLIAQLIHQIGLSNISLSARVFLKKGQHLENYSAKWAYEYAVNSVYSYAGKQLTKEQNQFICDFMVDNDIPIRSYTFRTLANRYLTSGELFIIRCNNCLGEGLYD